MFKRPKIRPDAPELSGEKRRFGRLVDPPVECSLGEVRNVSASGICVMVRDVPSAAGPVEVTLDGETFTTQVVWTRPVKGGGAIVGLEFESISPTLCETLLRIARRTLIGDDEVRKAA
jgi:hypothetical protein